MKPTTPLKPGLAKSSGVASRPPTAEERRRTQRVLLRMTVVVRIDGKPQPVQGITHTVSENGGLIVLREPLPVGTKITIENPTAQKSVEAKVARPPQISGEGSLIPVEFSTACPGFWGIVFPPAASAV